MEVGRVVMTTTVVRLDDIFAVKEKATCDEFNRDLDQMVPVKTLGAVRYSGCLYERDCENGVLNISQQTFAKQLVD